MRHYFFVTVIAMLFAVFGLFSCNAAAQASIKSSDQPLYENHAYGFKVKLPPDVTYTWTVPPNPDHGFGLALQGRGELWVDASYTDSLSAAEEAKNQSSGCHVEERRSTKLGNRPAIALRFSCPAGVDGDAYKELLVLTVSRQGDRSPAVYQVAMRATTSEVLSQNKGLFDKIVAGFRFVL